MRASDRGAAPSRVARVFGLAGWSVVELSRGVVHATRRRGLGVESCCVVNGQRRETSEQLAERLRGAPDGAGRFFLVDQADARQGEAARERGYETVLQR